MSLRLLWKPNFNQYFLVYEEPRQMESLTCSICKSKIVGRKIKSKILFPDSSIYIPEELFDLPKANSKLVNMELDIPLQANEWVIPLTKEHELEKIATKNAEELFKKSLPTLLREVNREFKSEYKHVYCFTILNHPSKGTLFHPQIRCFSFKHSILAPYWAKKSESQCSLCYEIRKVNENEVIFASRNILAYKPGKALAKEEMIVATKHHKSTQNATKKLINELIMALQTLLSKALEEKSESEYIYISYDFLPKNHIYIRIVKVDYGIKVEYQITKILSDRKIKLLFNNE